jgi:hypothetical protein
MVACVSALESRIVGQPVSGYGWRGLSAANRATGAETRALVEHALSNRPGDWRVFIVGAGENDMWPQRDDFIFCPPNEY